MCNAFSIDSKMSPVAPARILLAHGRHFIDRAENEGIEMVVAFEASRP